MGLPTTKCKMPAHQHHYSFSFVRYETTHCFVLWDLRFLENDDLKPFWPSTAHMRTVVRELIIYNFLVLIWCLLILEIGGWLWTYANYCIFYDLQKKGQVVPDNSQRFCLNNGWSNNVLCQHFGIFNWCLKTH